LAHLRETLKPATFMLSLHTENIKLVALP